MYAFVSLQNDYYVLYTNQKLGEITSEYTKKPDQTKINSFTHVKVLTIRYIHLIQVKQFQMQDHTASILRWPNAIQ